MLVCTSPLPSFYAPPISIPSPTPASSATPPLPHRCFHHSLFHYAVCPWDPPLLPGAQPGAVPQARTHQAVAEGDTSPRWHWVCHDCSLHLHHPILQCHCGLVHLLFGQLLYFCTALGALFWTPTDRKLVSGHGLAR